MSGRDDLVFIDRVALFGNRLLAQGSDHHSFYACVDVVDWAVCMCSLFFHVVLLSIHFAVASTAGCNRLLPISWGMTPKAIDIDPMLGEVVQKTHTVA